MPPSTTQSAMTSRDDPRRLAMGAADGDRREHEAEPEREQQHGVGRAEGRPERRARRPMRRSSRASTRRTAGGGGRRRAGAPVRRAKHQGGRLPGLPWRVRSVGPCLRRGGGARDVMRAPRRKRQGREKVRSGRRRPDRTSRSRTRIRGRAELSRRRASAAAGGTGEVGAGVDGRRCSSAGCRRRSRASGSCGSPSTMLPAGVADGGDRLRPRRRSARRRPWLRCWQESVGAVHAGPTGPFSQHCWNGTWKPPVSGLRQ